MEEQKKPEEQQDASEQTPTSYIASEVEANPDGNIFSELSEDMNVLDFGHKGDKEKQRRDRPPTIVVAHLVTSGLLAFTVFLAIIFSIDGYTRSAENNSFLSGLPICGYLAWGVENYENTDCKTLTMINSWAADERTTTEKTVTDNLVILVPKRMQTMNVANSPKVQFIQAHTGENRISVTDVMDRFATIKDRTQYQGADIDCNRIGLNAKGELDVSCDVYGWALLNPTSSTSLTSREVALWFLDNLSDEKSGFQILSSPKMLDISPFTSSDIGIRSIFSTKTTLKLKLRYLPSNKI